jgi:hypothetical protein
VVALPANVHCSAGAENEKIWVMKGESEGLTGEMRALHSDKRTDSLHAIAI